MTNDGIIFFVFNEIGEFMENVGGRVDGRAEYSEIGRNLFLFFLSFESIFCSLFECHEKGVYIILYVIISFLNC